MMFLNIYVQLDVAFMDYVLIVLNTMRFCI